MTSLKIKNKAPKFSIPQRLYTNLKNGGSKNLHGGSQNVKKWISKCPKMKKDEKLKIKCQKCSKVEHFENQTTPFLVPYDLGPKK